MRARETTRARARRRPRSARESPAPSRDRSPLTALRRPDARARARRYTLIVRSPSSKIFEIHSPKLEEWLNPWLNVEDVQQWRHENECPSSHMSQTYTATELLTQYYRLTDNIASKTALGLPNLLPIRSSIAVDDVSAVQEWFAQFVPSVQFNETTALGEPCQFITAKIPYYTTQSYSHEVRFVQNDWAPHGNRSVGEFIDYIDLVNANYTWSDGGWSAWYDRRMGLVPKAVRPGVKLRPFPLLRYDRHMGLMFKTCPLDKYMLKFNEQNIAFHPHGRDSETQNTGEPTDHCWTEGVQGYGIEMQGNFTYEYKDSAMVPALLDGNAPELRDPPLEPWGLPSNAWVEVTHCPVGACVEINQ